MSGRRPAAVVVVQARTGSTRLPRKSLAEIAGKPMILHVLERASRIGPPVILATTVDPADDELASVAERSGVDVVRGARDDVLARFVAAVPRGTDVVVRVTGDCPLLDPWIGAAVLAALRASRADYVSNTIVPTFPDGLDVEAFTTSALHAAADGSERPSDREHVTPVLKRSPRFRRLNVGHHPDLSDQRWTVDEESDLTFVRAVYERIGRSPARSRMSMRTVLDILAAEPALREINRGIERDEGYRRSLAADPPTG